MFGVFFFATSVTGKAADVLYTPHLVILKITQKIFACCRQMSSLRSMEI